MADEIMLIYFDNCLIAGEKFHLRVGICKNHVKFGPLGVCLKSFLFIMGLCDAFSNRNNLFDRVEQGISKC